MVSTISTLNDLKVSDPTEEGELSTSHLSGLLQDVEQVKLDSERTTDWVALLSTNPSTTAYIVDVPPAPAPTPSGMAAHSTAPRMKLTLGSRITVGLRRVGMLTMFTALAISVLAAATYTIYSTSWLTTMLSPGAPQAATTAPDPMQAAPPVVQPLQPQPQAPAQSQASDQSAVTGASAAMLRDKGIASYKAGNYAEAIASLENATTIDGGDALSYYQLGIAYMAVTSRDHSLEDAELAFRTAISLQPTWAPPHQLLAESLIRRGFYSEAIAPANEAVHLDTSQPEGWMTLGRAYEGAGQKTEAAKAYSEAARHAPAPPAQP